MLHVLDHLPPGLLEAPAQALADILDGPTLMHLPGAQAPPLFVSTLLHGNETSGWEALRRLLSRRQGRRLPRPLTVFIANVRAARERLRHLDDQPDYNRIWSPGPGPERVMAQQVLAAVRELGPLACLDIHNTSGENPVYACVHRLDDASRRLARAFSGTSVYVSHPDSLLAVACSGIAPALTLECGKPGRDAAIAQVEHFLDACLESGLPAADPEPPPDACLLRPVAMVRVPEAISFGFEDQRNHADVDLCFRSDLDGHNFSVLHDGTAIARVRPGSGARLEVLDDHGEDVSGRYFRLENESLVAASDLLPTLLTHNTRIIRQDCLCYLMESMAPG